MSIPFVIEKRFSLRIAALCLRGTEEMGFLEMKAGAPAVRGIDFSGRALPIRRSELIQQVQNQNSVDTMELEPILAGMVYMLGMDPDFPESPAYRKILAALKEDPVHYAIVVGHRTLRESSEETEKSSLFFALYAMRAAFLWDSGRTDAAIAYGDLLWRVAETLSETSERDALDTCGKRLLEQVLRREENNPQALLSFGERAAHQGDFLASDAYLQKALACTKNKDALSAIQRFRRAIAADVALANALYFIRRADYQKAEAFLLQAQEKRSRYDISYYLGVCYVNVGLFSEAVRSFSAALTQGADFPEAYRDYAFALAGTGECERAMQILSEGLEKFPADLRMRYNRAVLLGESGQVSEALSDCDFILEYADLSDEMFNQVMQLRDTLTR